MKLKQYDKDDIEKYRDQVAKDLKKNKPLFSYTEYCKNGCRSAKLTALLRVCIAMRKAVIRPLEELNEYDKFRSGFVFPHGIGFFAPEYTSYNQDKRMCYEFHLKRYKNFRTSWSFERGTESFKEMFQERKYFKTKAGKEKILFEEKYGI